jgi:hypothetical protein
MRRPTRRAATPWVALLRAPRAAAPEDSRALGVDAALALAAGSVPTAGREVYVILEPVRVLPRGGWGPGESWEVAGPLLKGRVLAAVAPLLAAGWRLGGTFASAARWDVSAEVGPPLYRGCWVRMHRGAP